MSAAFDGAYAPAGQVAAYVVHDVQTGHIAHFELFQASDVDEDALADAMIRRWEHLVTEFPVPRYDVEYGLFSSHDAFHEAFPSIRAACAR